MEFPQKIRACKRWILSPTFLGTGLNAYVYFISSGCIFDTVSTWSHCLQSLNVCLDTSLDTGCETSWEMTLQLNMIFFSFFLKVLMFLQFFFCDPFKFAIINFLKTSEKAGRYEDISGTLGEKQAHFISIPAKFLLSSCSLSLRQWIICLERNYISEQTTFSYCLCLVIY